MGFSLIELMIVVGVIGLLAAVVYPSYQSAVRKANRADAKRVMLDIAQSEERYFTNNNQYLAFGGAPAAATGGFANQSPDSPAAYKYSISVTTSATVPFTITATVGNGYTDPQCSTLTLDATGYKASYDSTSTQSTGCW